MFHVERIELIEEALDSEGMLYPPDMIGHFAEYRKLLLDWNQRVNLISRRDEVRIVTRHFLDSLGLATVEAFPRNSRMMDLGSGAGFPGIPLKLVRPDLRISLVESKRKKALFLRHAIEKLELEGIEIVMGRVEELTESLGLFDFVVSRSVTDLITLVGWSKDYLKPTGGSLIAIKGSDVEKELEQLKSMAPDWSVKRVRSSEYNPFPRILRSKKSVVVFVEWDQNM
jgi:16S rRNA (guanine527-N7)-methyltransferase